jgi:hypothetical protein
MVDPCQDPPHSPCTLSRCEGGTLRVLDPGLQYTLEGHESHEGQRGEEHEAEGVERRPHPGRSRDQTESHQAAGNRGEEHVCPAGRLRDCRCARTLEHEVLCGHKRIRRWTRLLLVVGRR